MREEKKDRKYKWNYSQLLNIVTATKDVDQVFFSNINQVAFVIGSENKDHIHAWLGYILLHTAEQNVILQMIESIHFPSRHINNEHLLLLSF